MFDLVVNLSVNDVNLCYERRVARNNDYPHYYFPPESQMTDVQKDPALWFKAYFDGIVYNKKK